jgi:hypothetical protein
MRDLEILGKKRSWPLSVKRRSIFGLIDMESEALDAESRDRD